MEVSPDAGTGASDILSYEADWVIYAMAFSYNQSEPFRVAIGSFVEGLQNKISILSVQKDSLELVLDFTHSYPPTKIAWMPVVTGSHPDLLISSGDHLRVW
jgi:WD repeat-containing protein 68